MKRFVTIAALAALALPFIELPAHADWVAGAVEWDEAGATYTGTGATHESNALQVNAYAQYAGGMNPGQEGSISITGYQRFTYSGGASSPAGTFDTDITLYAWGLATSGGNTISQAESSAQFGYYSASGSVYGGSSYQNPPSGTSPYFNRVSFANGSTLVRLPIGLYAHTKATGGSMGGLSCSANSVASGAFSDPYNQIFYL